LIYLLFIQIRNSIWYCSDIKTCSKNCCTCRSKWPYHSSGIHNFRRE